MHIFTTRTIRGAALLIGLILAGLTTRNILSGAAASQYWIELTTGTGLMFLVYLVPYVVFAWPKRVMTTSQALAAGAGLIGLSVVLLIKTAGQASDALRPQDVPMFDPALLVVLLQIGIAALAPKLPVGSK